jgi:hypothetical protein
MSANGQFFMSADTYEPRAGPWGKNYYDKDQPEVWRFEAHSRPYLDSKGKLVKGVGCPGEGKSLDEAWEIKHNLDATGGQFPDD